MKETQDKQQLNTPFRKNALEYINAPHALDDMIQITSPFSWVSLFSFWIFIGLIIVWLFIGRVELHVSGPGILFDHERQNEIVQITKSPLEALAFLPAVDGKHVMNGMRVLVTPSTVRPLQYGSIVGKVIAVDNLPSTPESMQDKLRNKSLVDEFLKKGPVIMVRIQLIPEPHNQSGLLWTSSKGPPTTITAGTLVNISITTKKQSPLSLIFPFLNKDT